VFCSKTRPRETAASAFIARAVAWMSVTRSLTSISEFVFRD